MADCFEEYIDRWIFIAEKRKQYCVNCNRRKGMKNGKLRFCYDIGEAPCRACEINDMLNDVEAFPSVDVAPVRHGRWNEESPDCLDGDSVYVCTVCGETWTLIEGTPLDNNMHYCPNCGAKMNKEMKPDGV